MSDTHTSGELVAVLRERNPGMGEVEAKRMVDRVFGALSIRLNRPDARVRISGFGTFTTKDRPERQGRHPGTGEPITVAAKRIVTFKSSSRS